MKTWGMLFAGLAVLGVLIPVGVTRASTYREMKQGADSYKRGKYRDSLAHFHQAQIESPDDLKVRFNIASTQYQTGSYDEAIRGFKAVALQSHDPKLIQKAIYNLGNTAFRQGNLQTAVDFYRRAVDLNPSDLDAKQNLEFVLRELAKKNKEKGPDVSKKEAERQEDQKPPPSQSHQGRERNNDPEASQTGQTVKQGAFSPDEAERLLNSVSDDQRAFLKEQAKRFAPMVRAKEKDW